MTFEQRWAEFVQANPALAVTESARATFTIAQLRQICSMFWRTESTRACIPPNPIVDIFESLFNQDWRR